jgi:hypothetical protein
VKQVRRNLWVALLEEARDRSGAGGYGRIPIMGRRRASLLAPALIIGMVVAAFLMLRSQ